MKRFILTDSDGTRVKVNPSSGVEVYGPRGRVAGPFVWLDVEPREGASAAAHLTRKEARAICEALTRWLDEGGAPREEP